MSLSPTSKRKHPGPDADALPPKRSKARSCEACRRLKTRCEMQHDSIACHRCRTLGLECSLRPTSGQQVTAPTKLQGSNNAPPESPLEPRYVAPLVADRNSRDAPMSLIRDMKQYILGAEKEWHPDTSDDIITKGIVSEELVHTLLDGFSQLSRRWLFLRLTPIQIREASPLLFATCTLAGLHINRNLHGSEMHQNLYNHITGMMSKCMLISPLSLETIQSMLILSMWNLVPDKDTEHIDGWLLSGTAAMHGMLALNFEQIVQSQKDRGMDPRSREALRSWNLICLCHLQFSVGTGRPPVLSRQYLKQCENILSLPFFDSRDHLVVAGVKLYSAVCGLANSDIVQTDNLAWVEIDNWKRDCGLIFELDSSKPLRFAYSCSYLIMARRTLKHISQQPTDQRVKHSAMGEPLSNRFIQLAIEHSHRLLNLFLAMSDLTAFIRPAYENLLCSFAMVTLCEFAIYLEDANATLEMMEKTSFHIQLGGKAEPVSKWALNVLRKFVFDLHQVPAAFQAEGNAKVADPHVEASTERIEESISHNLEEVQSEIEGMTNAEFPSLEEMFLAS